MSQDLPQGWATAELHECVDVLDSIRVPINSDERAKRQGNVTYYGATGQVGTIDDFLFNEELLLIGEDGAPFFDKAKPIAYVIKGKSWVNNHAHVLRAHPHITTNDYLKHFLDWFDFHDYVNGTTRLKLTQGSMNRIPVRLAPISEQRRIVTKLERLSGQVDACQRRLANIPVLLKRFRQAVLAAACSGRLSTDWRDEVAEQDLILPEPANLDGVTEIEALTEAAESWRWLPLQALCDPHRTICYGVIKLGVEVPTGVPCLRTSDVKPLAIDTTGVKRIALTISDEYRRTLLRGGEVLVNVRGTLGGVAVVPDSLRGWNISREVAVVPVQGVVPKFIAFWIASLPCQNWLTGVAKGVAYTGINIADLKLLPVALPSLSEQQEIVRRVEGLFALADRLEARYMNARAYVDNLTQSILARAFRGELVEQDPNDEPASALLERTKMAQPARPSKRRASFRGATRRPRREKATI